MAKGRPQRNSTSKKQQLLTQLFADQVVIVIVISDTEDNLQKSVYELNGIITEHSLTLSARKTKLMTFKG
jgi:PII-like signaling protein